MEDCGHTSAWTGPTVERTKSNGKRIFSAAFKFWMVEEARRPGVSVAGLAMQHGVNPNQLHRWMRLPHWRRDAGPRLPAPVLLPVKIEMEQVAVASTATPAPATLPSPPSAIEIEFSGVIVRVTAGVDATTLRTVLAALRG